ncbi:Eukaryotic translation initiation factor 2D [Stylophora pistillata]|uniref:Eukaryotic translation initiation factor 2D n=1 Tax=Stylophora pistillata TaxID=50429 RepID=A0A2B4RWZ7_STYPI|nr:Eukaryotic translation initiation factor 2D [Stylophora pistillata]
MFQKPFRVKSNTSIRGSDRGEPIFFEVEKKVFPTDLMLPGVILPCEGLSALGRFERGTLCSVCLKGNRAPVAVGTTLVSSKDLLEDGLRGKGVKIEHVYLDQLWAQGSKTQLPQLNETNEQVEMANVNDHMQELSFDETEDINHKEVEETESSEGFAQRDGRREEEVSVQESNGLNPLSTSVTNADSDEVGQEFLEFEGETNSQDKLLENMDDLLEYCFFCSLMRMKKVELPVLTSTFSRSYLLPSCPEGKSVDIKKSSYKKLSKFLQCMQERGLISLQEASKGVDHITRIAWDHPELKDFKANAPAVDSVSAETSSPSCSAEPPCIEELFSVSAALLPIFSEFGFRKNDIINHAGVRSTMTNYVKAHDLVSNEDKRMVLLDPSLTKILLNKHEDIEVLPWDRLFERVSSKMNNCHRITLPGQEPIVRKGKIDSIEIKVEQRMGNKKVTLIRNLESYGIDPQEFAHNVQIKAACSTSVSQLPGKHTAPGLQVLVQGNQVAIVAKFLLDEYKIPKRYISGLDILKSGKKKKK